MPFHNKQAAESTSKPKPTWGEEREDKRQQHNGDRRQQPRDGDRRQQPREDTRRPQHHTGEPREQKTPCSFGETCRFVNSDQGCRDYHLPEHVICRWDDKCTRQGCRHIHPSHADASAAPSQPTERPARSERPAPFQNVERPEHQPYKKAPQDNAMSTDAAIEHLRQQLAALEKTKTIEDFKKQQRVTLDQFVAKQAAELEAFMKSQ